MKLLWISAMVLLALSGPCLADNSLKEAGKDIGQGFKKIGQDTGKAFKEGALGPHTWATSLLMSRNNGRGQHPIFCFQGDAYSRLGWRRKRPARHSTSVTKIT